MQCSDSDEEVYHVSESSSEEELEHVPDNTADLKNSSTGHNAISQLIIMFLCLWQSVFTISDAALEMLLKFLASLFKA